MELSLWDLRGKMPGPATFRDLVRQAEAGALDVRGGTSPGLFDRIPVLDGPWSGRYNVIAGEATPDYGLSDEELDRFIEHVRDVIDYGYRRQALPAPATGSFTGWIRRYANTTTARDAFGRVPGWIEEDSRRYRFTYEELVGEADRYRISQLFPSGEAAVQEWRRAGDEFLGGMVIGGPINTAALELYQEYQNVQGRVLDGYFDLFDCPAPCDGGRDDLRRAIEAFAAFG